jgi:hypothetical protein
MNLDDLSMIPKRQETVDRHKRFTLLTLDVVLTTSVM